MSEEETKFSLFRTITVSKRVLKQITRDKRTFGMMIMMPIIIMVVFGISLSGEVNNLRIVVDNQDTGFPGINKGNDILSSLKSDNRVKVSTNTWDNSIKKVEKGDLFAVLRIPKNFTNELIAKFSGESVIITLDLYIDSTKPAIKGSIMGAIQDALTDALGNQGVEIQQTIAFNGAEYTGLDTAIPAVMGFVLTFLVMIISLLTIVRENIGGTQERIYTTPLTKIERILGYILALTLFGLIEVIAILIIGVVIFGSVVKGSLILLIMSAFLYALVHVLLSVFLANFTENELQAVQMAPLTALPSMALSGMLVPVNSLPQIAVYFSYFIPLTYGIKIFEGIMLKGLGFSELWFDYLILNIFVLILLILASITVKDHLDE